MHLTIARDAPGDLVPAMDAALLAAARSEPGRARVGLGMPPASATAGGRLGWTWTGSCAPERLAVAGRRAHAAARGAAGLVDIGRRAAAAVARRSAPRRRGAGRDRVLRHRVLRSDARTARFARQSLTGTSTRQPRATASRDGGSRCRRRGAEWTRETPGRTATERRAVVRAGSPPLAQGRYGVSDDPDRGMSGRRAAGTKGGTTAS